MVRGEPPRFYTDLFAPTSRYIRGVEKFRILRSRERLPAAALSHTDTDGASGKIFEFPWGVGDLFASILTRHELVAARLREITRAKHLPSKECPAPHIAVHVRLGDFSLPRDARDFDVKNGTVNFRMPIDWYCYVTNLLREALDDRIEIRVYSDGSDQELGPLLEIKGVRRMRGQSSLRDLLSLAQATVLVASGSTFSMWASYLGRMPVVWHPGQIRQRLYTEKPDAEVEVGFGERLNAGFIDITRRMMTWEKVGMAGR